MARSRALSGILLLSLLFAVPALAQRVASTVRGTVKDTSGAVIVGAKVSVKNEATGLTRASETNASGSYAFADLPIGTYTIDDRLPGLQELADEGHPARTSPTCARSTSSSRPARSASP